MTLNRRMSAEVNTCIYWKWKKKHTYTILEKYVFFFFVPTGKYKTGIHIYKTFKHMKKMINIMEQNSWTSFT